MAKPFTDAEIAKIRQDFPALQQKVHGKDLVYLDNAATSQKPQAVIDAIVKFYREDCANIHRAVHSLSQRSTEAYEGSRKKAANFIGAATSDEIIFVPGTTEAINLIAYSFGERLQPGEEILVTELEHHSDIVPWQLLCERRGLKLNVLPIDDNGDLKLDELPQRLTAKTRLMALTHVSNSLGTVNPLKEIVAECHKRGVVVAVDGAQSVPHFPVNVQDLDCDFFAFSGHKMLGPTGIGVLYGKKALLDSMPPFLGGGHMIREVHFGKTTYAPVPDRFEAGTASIAGGIGLGAAIDYLENLGMDRVWASEQQLTAYAVDRLSKIKGLQWVGHPKHRAGVLSFNLVDVHPHDVGTILDQEGIAIRVGHHCTQPLMERYRVAATCRASLAVYNTAAEIDALCRGLERVQEVFGTCQI